MRLHRQFARNLSGLGDTGNMQTLPGVRQSACSAMGGSFVYDSSFNQGGAVDPLGTCYIYNKPAPPPAPAPAQITVSPTIQTQVSPQVSPVFQQSYMPQNSPMSAGTTQNMPTGQAGTTQPAAPQSASADQSAALLSEQQKMIEALLSKMSAPSAPQAPAPSSPVPQTTYTPPQQLPSVLVGAAMPSVDTTSSLPQFGMSADAQTALTAMRAAGKAPLPAPVSTAAPSAKSNTGLLLALVAGAGVLFLVMNSKGNSHAA